MKREKCHWISGRIQLLLISVAVAGLDQMIKRFVESYEAGDVILRFAPWVEIVYTVNVGAAFSILSGRNVLLLLITTTVLLLLAVVMLFYSRMSPAARLSISLLLGGGLGNWIDRSFSGGVTDYIKLLFVRFPVFNFADICITVSVTALIVLLITDRFENTTGEKYGRTD